MRLASCVLVSCPGAVHAVTPPPCGCRAPSARTSDCHHDRHRAAARRREVESNVGWARVALAGERSATLQERMAAYRVPGLSIAVVHAYQIEWIGAYGWADRAARRRVGADTRFAPGSLSKALHAVGVLRLAREGRVRLDADVATYLRSWTLPPALLAKGRPVTLASLLSHTAGLSVRGFWGYRPGNALPTVPQLLDGLPPANSAPVRSLFPPGARVAYSGGGTMVSQQVVMDVTREPYAAFMQRTVLAPLGMTHSSFEQPPPAALAQRLATGHSAAGAPIPGRYPVMPEQAAAGLWTTAADVARFVVAVQCALAHPAEPPPGPIDAPVARWLTTPVRPGAPALGLFVRDTVGIRYFAHAAGNAGMSGILIGNLRGDGVVVLQNGESAELLDEVVRTVARVYGWPGLADAPRPAPRTLALAPARLDAYVGTYREGDMVLTIERPGATLTLQGPGAPRRLLFTAADTAVTQESGARLRFVRGPGGAVTALALLRDGREAGRAARVPPVAPSPAALARYAGTYRDERGAVARVLRRDGALWLDLDGAPRRMRFLSETEFHTVEDFGVGLRIARTAMGRVTGLVQTVAGTRVVYRRVSR